MQPLRSTFFMFLLLLQLPATVLAGNNYLSKVQGLLDSSEAPDGVVFEIANKDKNYLGWAMPEAERLSKQLRAKFPELDIAIVTHGSEQFALTKKQLENNTHLKDQLKSLMDSDIQIHVCGTHAEWKKVDAEEFTELVDVAAEGPAQINDYIKLGYVKIKITKN